MLLRREFRFEAAHTTLTNEACKSLHGHGYRLRIGLEGSPDPASGFMVDFEAVERIVGERVLALLDHSHLNEVIALPTAENIAVWVWRRLEGHLEGLAEVGLWETPDNGVIYRGEPLPEAVGAAAAGTAEAGAEGDSREG